MIGVKVTFEDHTPEVLERTRQGTRRALARGAFSTRQVAIESIDVSPFAGPAGGPVRTRLGLARRAVAYAVQDREAIIGFAYSIIGRSMEKHEKGKIVGKRRYPVRPTMQLAVRRSLGQISGAWAGAITQQ